MLAVSAQTLARLGLEGPGCCGEPACIARDLARNNICNMTIAPSIFGTPMLFGMPKEVQDALAAGARFSSRLDAPLDNANPVRRP